MIRRFVGGWLPTLGCSPSKVEENKQFVPGDH
jgi:hypothetical protein